MKFSVSGFDCNCDECSTEQSVDESEIPPLPSFKGAESREEINDALREWEESLPEGVEPADVFAANASRDGGHRPMGVFASESSDRPTGVMSRGGSDDVLDAWNSATNGEYAESAAPNAVLAAERENASSASSSAPSKQTGVNYVGQGGPRPDRPTSRSRDGPGPVLTRPPDDDGGESS